LILRVLNEVKTLDNTEGAIKIYIPEKLETLSPQDRKNSFIFMVNCCTLSTNSVLIKCAKGMGGGGCVGGFFFHSPLSVDP
jgi:hypothetical protein